MWAGTMGVHNLSLIDTIPFMFIFEKFDQPQRKRRCVGGPHIGMDMAVRGGSHFRGENYKPHFLWTETVTLDLKGLWEATGQQRDGFITFNIFSWYHLVNTYSMNYSSKSLLVLCPVTISHGSL
jgi:hypothetical protein